MDQQPTHQQPSQPRRIIPVRDTPPSPDEVTASGILNDLIAAWDATREAWTVEELTTACQWLAEVHLQAQQLIVAGLQSTRPG